MPKSRPAAMVPSRSCGCIDGYWRQVLRRVQCDAARSCPAWTLNSTALETKRNDANATVSIEDRLIRTIKKATGHRSSQCSPPYGRVRRVIRQNPTLAVIDSLKVTHKPDPSTKNNSSNRKYATNGKKEASWCRRPYSACIFPSTRLQARQQHSSCPQSSPLHFPVSTTSQLALRGSESIKERLHMGNSESRDASSFGAVSSSSSRPVRRSLPPQSSVDASDMTGASVRDERRSASMPNERAATASRRPRPRSSRRAPSSSNSSTDDDRLETERGGIERAQEATEEASSQLSYWYLIKHGYTELVHLIIRPPRTTYKQEDLGPNEFSFAGRAFVREDFTVVNDRRQKLVCSHWRPVTPSASQQLMPCVVYLHGNSSCRLEALGVLRTCLAAGLTVAAFDTAGCGKSDGEYISLGYYERDDLRDVVTHLRAKMNIGAVALWGRSMGAATALLHADREPSIAGIVVDSAFASLEQLVEEVVDRGRQEGLTLPGFLVKIVLKFIRSSVKKRAYFDVRRLAPIDHAPVSFVPALFVAAEHDSFVAPHHSDQIYAAYGGDKNMVKVDGDHNSSRPQFLLDSAAIFIQTALQVEAVATAQPNGFTDGLTGCGGRAPWEGAKGRTSSLSMCSSPASSYCMTLDMDARYSGKNSMLVPMAPWPCPSCTFVNRPLSMQCEMCRNIYLPDDDDEVENAGDEEDALASEVARRRALTTDGVRPPPAPTQSRGGPRRRTIDAVPSPSPSFESCTSAILPAHSERSVDMGTATTAPTSVSSRPPLSP